MIVKTYDEDDDIKVHRVPLIMAGVLVISTIAMSAAVSWGYLDREAVPSETRAAAGTHEVATRQIQFFDAPNGMVRVEDANTGVVIGEYDRGTGGFVRQTARALVHQRRIRGIGAETGFELVEWDDGALTLIDPTTDRTIELASFGADNRKIFADMLHVDGSVIKLSQKGAE